MRTNYHFPLLCVVLLASLRIGGTAQSPALRYDVTAGIANFDAMMAAFPPGKTILIGPGTYETMGSAYWSPKSRQKIIGAGMSSTVIRLSHAAQLSGSVAIVGVKSPYTQTNITVSDLTLDGNWMPGTVVTIHALGLHGSGNTVERVRLINQAAWSGTNCEYREAWGIHVSGWPFPDATNNVIRDCVVSNFTANCHNNLSALYMLENNSGQILSNLVVQSGGNAVFGFGCGSHDCSAIGNRLVGVVVGSHYDDGTGTTNCLVMGNQFLNCSAAVDWANGKCEDVRIVDNEIVLTNSDPSRFTCEAVNLYPLPATFRNVEVSGNTVTVATPRTKASLVVAGNNTDNLLVFSNRLSPNLSSAVKGATRVSVRDNLTIKR